MTEHFELTITETRLRYMRKHAAIEAEARLDGIYATHLGRQVRALGRGHRQGLQKSRCGGACLPLPEDRGSARPSHLPQSRRPARPHVFLCMLAYYVEWHMREALVPQVARSSMDPPLLPWTSAALAALCRTSADCLSHYNGHGDAEPGSLAYYGSKLWHTYRARVRETLAPYGFERNKEVV